MSAPTAVPEPNTAPHIAAVAAAAAAPPAKKLVFDHAPVSRTKNLDVLLEEAVADPSRFFALVKVAPADVQQTIKDAIALVDRKSVTTSNGNARAASVADMGKILTAQGREIKLLSSAADVAFREAAQSGREDATIISMQQDELVEQRSIAATALDVLFETTNLQKRQSERDASVISSCFVTIGEANAEIRRKDNEAVAQQTNFMTTLTALIKRNEERLDKKDANFAAVLDKKDADAEKARLDFAAALAKKDANFAAVLDKKDADAEKARLDFIAVLDKKDADFAAALAKKDADAEKAGLDFAAVLEKKDADAEKARLDFAAALAKKDADAEKARLDFAAVLEKKDADAKAERDTFWQKMDAVTRELRGLSDQMDIIRLSDLSLTAELVLQKHFATTERASKICKAHAGEKVHGIEITPKLGAALLAAGNARLFSVHKAAAALVKGQTLSAGVPAVDLSPALQLLEAVPDSVFQDAVGSSQSPAP